MTDLNIGDYQGGDSKSLKEIDGQKITIVNVEQSDYNDNLGVKITTDNGEKYHTTRVAIVSKFFTKSSDGRVTQTKLTDDINNGGKLCVKTELQKGEKGKNDYWIFVDGNTATPGKLD